MSWPIVLGLVATWLVEASALPQLWRLHQQNDTDGASLLWLCLHLLGRLVGLSAAIVEHSELFIAFFLVGTLVRGALLAKILAYRSQHRSLQHV
ncbi:PQ-loop domain-containing transporter [Armatimonas rosea]|uniref:Uncharacterized protein with PQ loop repeat n=1 Tax=Armatimonas rosea TaxID=685828 RepID=A0A7W9SNH5_ARMRO|nr:PQ-loop domain-containing transporter [Armatimonas rosea]MBB6049570.1 uncharacterized protein with PQ loop repeat [Armatimonas rosea]